MAAGQGFIEFSTGDILTAAAANGYLASQVVMVFADAAARTSAITSPQEGMFSYLKDTNTTQYYSGSAWVTIGGASPLTTKGDLYTYSTTDARLAVGTNGQVLKADSTAATGLKWETIGSGSLTKIRTETFTSSSAVNVNSVFSSTYTNYFILAEITNSTSNVDSYFKLRASGVDSSSSYSLFGWLSQGSSVSAENWTTAYPIIRAGSTTRSVGQITVLSPFSASPTGFIGDSGGSHGYSAGLNGRHTASTSYDGFSLTCGSGTITGTVTIYGYEA